MFFGGFCLALLCLLCMCVALADGVKDWAAELSAAKQQAPLAPPSRQRDSSSYWEPPELVTGSLGQSGEGAMSKSAAGGKQGAFAAAYVRDDAGRISGSGQLGARSMSTSVTTQNESLLTTGQSPGESPARSRLLQQLEKLQQLRFEGRELFGTG